MSTVFYQILERDIPKIPPIVAEIIAELQDPKSVRKSALVDKIEACGNLSNIILDMLNSGYLRTKRNVDNIGDAFLLVGIEALRNIILAVLVKLLFPRRQLLDTFDRSSFLRHSLGTGIAARMLYKEMTGSDEDSYKFITYGFVHDLGILALDYCLPVTLNRIHTLARDDKISLARAEVRILGNVTHSAIGAWIAERWNLPEDMTEIIRYHHTPRRGKINREDTILLYIGDTISMSYYETLLSRSHTYSLDSDLVGELGLSMEGIDRVATDLPARVEQAMKLLNVDSIDSISLMGE